MKRRLCLTIATVMLVSAGTARATTLQRMTLEELAAASPAIARVRCIANETRWEGGRIWTFTTAEVTEVIKGHVPARITIRMIGGNARSVISKVEGTPRFSPQEEVVLFLQPTRLGDWTVVSWVQGTFRIHRDGMAREERVTQDTAGVALFNPAARSFEEGGARNLPMREFRRRLAKAMARTGETGR